MDNNTAAVIGVGIFLICSALVAITAIICDYLSNRDNELVEEEQEND